MAIIYYWFLFFSLNSSWGKLGVMKGLRRQNVSNIRKYNFVSDAKVTALKMIQMKKRSEAKMNWGVKAFIEWREERLLNFNYDVTIYFSDLQDLSNLKLENFHHAMY